MTKMAATQITPCPDCGLTPTHHHNGVVWIVSCSECADGEHRPYGFSAMSLEDAHVDWNRYIEDAEDEE